MELNGRYVARCADMKRSQQIQEVASSMLFADRDEESMTSAESCLNRDGPSLARARVPLVARLSQAFEDKI